MRRIVIIFALSAMLFLSACNSNSDTANHSNKPLVLSTIKPIQALVVAIAGDQVEARQLLPDNASPHQYSVLPSDASALERAEVIIRIDSQLEAQLDPALQNLRPNQKLLTLSSAPNINLLPPRTLATETEHEEHTQDEHDHDTPYDLHIWLDPNNGIAMAQAIRDTLSKRYPELASTFAHNTQTLIQAIQATDQTITQRLKPLQGKRYITFHDAWQYFDKHYGMQLGGTISTGITQQVSAQHLQQLYDTVRTQQLTCLFYEPQFSPQVLETMAKELKLTTVMIDPIGSKIALSPTAYPQLLQGIADSFVHCLQP